MTKKQKTSCLRKKWDRKPWKGWVKRKRTIFKRMTVVLKGKRPGEAHKNSANFSKKKCPKPMLITRKNKSSWKNKKRLIKERKKERNERFDKVLQQQNDNIMAMMIGQQQQQLQQPQAMFMAQQQQPTQALMRARGIIFLVKCNWLVKIISRQYIFR